MAKNILQTLSGFQSYDQIRIISPLLTINDQLKDEGTIVKVIPLANLNLDVAKNYDAVCIHGLFSINLINILRKINFSVWSDDLISNVPDYNMISPNKAKLEALQWAFDNAQSIVCTTPILANELGHPDKTCIAPNLIRSVGEMSNSENILWAGGNSHSQDLELLGDYDLPNKLMFFSHTLPTKLSFYGRNRRGGVEIRPNRENIGHIQIERLYEKYQTYMNNIDFGIGLCPLLDHPFNAAKSVWKPLEYIEQGAISVVSDVQPYSGIPDDCVVKVKDGDDWNEKIQYALENKKSIYDNCKKYVEENYTYGCQGDNWLDAYRGI